MGTRILGLTGILAFFTVLATPAAAQPPATALPAWDFAVTAGSFHGQSADEGGSGYRGDRSTSLSTDWHHAAEWRVMAGRYWTPHLKTEVELGATGEGDRYVQRFAAVPGSATPYPYGVQEFVRLRQGSAHVSWQFLDNQWIHPYLSAGVSVAGERTRSHVFLPVFYPDPRNPSTRAVGTAEHDEAPGTTYRTGVVLGGGAKWYVSPRVFIKTGAQVGLARHATSVNFLAGMGFDF